ncbi:MAG: DsrE family protein [Thermoleophilia bacterium]|nr:DsrE family protein [Thermoleophilia bacterium]
MKQILLVLNDPPYGTERCYNALRLAGSLAKRDATAVRIFLLGDAVGCAVAGQVLPDGFYHLDRMLKAAIRSGAEVGCCGTCLEARAINEAGLVEGARRSTLEELTDWTIWADRVVTF